MITRAKTLYMTYSNNTLLILNGVITLSEQLKTGTTTIGIVCKDGIIIAADKRATAGHYVAGRAVDKVIQINESMVLTIAGTVSDAQKFVKLIKAETRLNKLHLNRDNSAKEAANLIGNLTYSYLRGMGAVTHFLFAAKNADGSCELYDISPDGVVWQISEFATSGSGSFFADGVLETNYKKDMTTQEGHVLAKQALNASMQRDSASGNGADIYKVTTNGVEKIETITVNTGIFQ